MLRLSGIHKYYNPGTVNEMCLFENFNLEIEQGQFVSVVGSNGSGKTSMLNIICGSIPIEAGAILLTKKRLPSRKNSAGILRLEGFIRIQRWDLSQHDNFGKYVSG